MNIKAEIQVGKKVQKTPIAPKQKSVIESPQNEWKGFSFVRSDETCYVLASGVFLRDI